MKRLLIFLLIFLLTEAHIVIARQVSNRPKTYEMGGAVSSVIFTPNGKSLVVAVNNKAYNSVPSCDIQWRDVASGKIKRRTIQGIPLLGLAMTLAFSPDGKILVVGGGEAQISSFVNLYNAHSGKLIRSLRGDGEYVNSVAFSKDGDSLVAGGGIRWGVVRLWNVRTGKLRRGMEWEDTVTVRTVAFMPNGKTVIGDGFVWDTLSGKSKPALYSAVTVISPDSKLLARTDEANNQARCIRITDIATGKIKHLLRGHNGAVNAIAFSPDGKWLCSGSDDKTIRLYEVNSGRLQRVFKGHNGKVTSISFSPRGSTIASGGEDGTVKVWRLK